MGRLGCHDGRSDAHDGSGNLGCASGNDSFGFGVSGFNAGEYSVDLTFRGLVHGSFLSLFTRVMVQLNVDDDAEPEKAGDNDASKAH